MIAVYVLTRFISFSAINNFTIKLVLSYHHIGTTFWYCYIKMFFNVGQILENIYKMKYINAFENNYGKIFQWIFPLTWEVCSL